TDYPKLPGTHCLNSVKHGKVVSVPVYDCVVRGSLTTMIPRPEFRTFYNKVRSKYFSISSAPCVGIIPSPLSPSDALQTEFNITIRSGSTVNWYRLLELKGCLWGSYRRE